MVSANPTGGWSVQMQRLFPCLGILNVSAPSSTATLALPSKRIVPRPSRRSLPPPIPALRTSKTSYKTTILRRNSLSVLPGQSLMPKAPQQAKEGGDMAQSANESAPSSSNSDASEKQYELMTQNLVNIINNEASNILVLVGAGASIGSGLPYNGSSDEGLFSVLAKQAGKESEEFFHQNHFDTAPGEILEVLVNTFLTPRQPLRPTTAHYFLRLLQDRKKLLRIYTQNVDGLERAVGIGEDKLVEVFGNMRTGHCTKCKEIYFSDEYVVDLPVPHCTTVTCQGTIKPDLVFYGTALPHRYTLFEQDCAECDLIIIVGSSLEVFPPADLPDQVPAGVPRVLINDKPAGTIGQRSKDYFVQGDVMRSCMFLIDVLGWRSDYDTLFTEMIADRGMDNRGDYSRSVGALFSIRGYLNDIGKIEILGTIDATEVGFLVVEYFGDSQILEDVFEMDDYLVLVVDPSVFDDRANILRRAHDGQVLWKKEIPSDVLFKPHMIAISLSCAGHFLTLVPASSVDLCIRSLCIVRLLRAAMAERRITTAYLEFLEQLMVEYKG
ncbi:unnamed protein product [Cyprideis torosa]|uniref:Uncharacterized protein n=1 Tax=Cyprideis torosa TaxID=163714 RepID=A0A7R8ZGS7_9CRUS|nr:unnamed protein product [Cyprideis torosa]CAG0880933.1 unnamed protein product [Cyprideis torosa]